MYHTRRLDGTTAVGGCRYVLYVPIQDVYKTGIWCFNTRYLSTSEYLSQGRESMLTSHPSPFN